MPPHASAGWKEKAAQPGVAEHTLQHSAADDALTHALPVGWKKSVSGSVEHELLGRGGRIPPLTAARIPSTGDTV